MKIKYKKKSELLPFANLDFESNQDILKSIIARSFKLGQLIVEDE